MVRSPLTPAATRQLREVILRCFQPGGELIALVLYNRRLRLVEDAVAEHDIVRNQLVQHAHCDHAIRIAQAHFDHV